MAISNRDSNVIISNVASKTVFNEVLYAYIRKQNKKWLKEQLFKKNAKLSHFVDYLITQARLTKINYIQDDYLRECGIVRKRTKKDTIRVSETRNSI